MFHRILVEEWQRVLSVVSISIFFFSFIITVIRILRTPKAQMEHVENLPLENDAVSHE